MFIEKYVKDIFIHMNFRNIQGVLFLTNHEKSNKCQYSLHSWVNNKALNQFENIIYSQILE